MPLGRFSLQKVFEAVEAVRQHLLRATSALEARGVDYAVVGGHAVAAWVRRVDEGGVRNTPDVDLLIRRADFDAASAALEAAGFVPAHIKGVGLFLDGPGAKARNSVHVVFAGEKVRPEYEDPAPDVGESQPTSLFRVLNLPALLRMKLTSYRRKDQVHILDMIGVGLIDETWLPTLTPTLAGRLKTLLDDPEG